MRALHDILRQSLGMDNTGRVVVQPAVANHNGPIDAKPVRTKGLRLQLKQCILPCQRFSVSHSLSLSLSLSLWLSLSLSRFLSISVYLSLYPPACRAQREAMRAQKAPSATISQKSVLLSVYIERLVANSFLRICNDTSTKGADCHKFSKVSSMVSLHRTQNHSFQVLYFVGLFLLYGIRVVEVCY